MKKNPFNDLIPSLLFSSCLFLLISCGSKKDSDDKTGSPVAPVAPVAPAAMTSTGFYHLSMDSATIWNIFKDPNSKKILLQFVDSNNTAFSLIAYGAQKMKTNHTTTSALSLKIEPDAPWDTNGKKILGNLELTKKEIKMALGGSGALKASDCKRLYFSPYMDQLYPYYVLYHISTIKSDKGFAGTETKPSPPAPPCATCD